VTDVVTDGRKIGQELNQRHV